MRAFYTGRVAFILTLTSTSRESGKLKSIPFPKVGGMEREQDLELGKLKCELQAIAADVRALSGRFQSNNLALLELLRTLERLHREICEGVFQASLPDNRQALYALLKDIEDSGGWPYIDRMKLRSLLANIMPDGSSPNNNPESPPGP